MRLIEKIIVAICVIGLLGSIGFFSYTYPQSRAAEVMNEVLVEYDYSRSPGLTVLKTDAAIREKTVKCLGAPLRRDLSLKFFIVGKGLKSHILLWSDSERGVKAISNCLRKTIGQK